MIEMGVDHIGSVIPSLQARHNPIIRETVSLVREKGAISSLIPLYSEPYAVFDTLDYYRPHIVHFCETLGLDGGEAVEKAIQLQMEVKSRFPDVRIMRAIPIGRRAWADCKAILSLATRLEPVTDF